jgi:superfamily II DNA or RNA helicase
MSSIPYTAFLADKVKLGNRTGIDIDPGDLHPMLKPHQRALTAWAVRKGTAAIFADTGLGKSFMQLEWARAIDKRTLFLAPLSVARQTVREAAKLDMPLAYARRQSDAERFTITNYEMVEHFDLDAFGAVVLDESSILKATEGVYRNKLNAAFARTPFRLCCTATPAPNDIQELTNHSEFLGVMRRRDVLAIYFLHASDDARASGWRLKGHARVPFYRWLASWAMSLKRPSDLGFPDDGYILPPLSVQPIVVPSDYVTPGKLFAHMKGITDRSAVRHGTLRNRVNAAASRISEEPAEPWIAWVGLNDEAEALVGELGSRAVEVKGSDSPERKAELLEGFIAGHTRILVTKTRIAGFGMNFQHCARQVFVGINDSYEQYYQAIRRSWRFGQSRPVYVYVVISEPERAIYDNVLRKEREAEEMSRELVRHVIAFERDELTAAARTDTGYLTKQSLQLPWWLA